MNEFCVTRLHYVATDGLNRIYIHCAEGNLKSRAIPERLGFVLEGSFQDGECLYGTYHNLIIYGFVNRNWKKNDLFCLILPSPEHKNAAIEYKQEHIDYGEAYMHGSGGLHKPENYENWLDKIISGRTTVQPGYVPGTVYFAFFNSKLVGTIAVRHYLKYLYC